MKRAMSAAWVVGLSVALTGVAQAAQAGNSQYCTGAWVCVYKNSDFGVGLGYRSTSFALVNISDANNDEVSSWENRRGANARWYEDANGFGQCHNMAKYDEDSSIPWPDNDTMSSWAGDGAC